MIKAVIWDFGGVLTSSPFEAFNRYEAENGLPTDFIRGINATDPDTNAWALFERSEISAEEFDGKFAIESEAQGHRVPGADVIALLAGDIRPDMVTALNIVSKNFKTGCITNNVPAGEGAGMARTHEKAQAVAEVMSLFQEVIESSKIGMRKPDPRIYQLMCEKLEIEPSDAVYLDDLGINCKPARALGMATIKVTDPDIALTELESIVGMPLRG